MEERDKAFVIAAIQVKIKNDEKKEREIKQKSRKGKRGR